MNFSNLNSISLNLNQLYHIEIHKVKPFQNEIIEIVEMFVAGRVWKIVLWGFIGDWTINFVSSCWKFCPIIFI